MKKQLLDNDKEGFTCQFSQPLLKIYLSSSHLSGAVSGRPTTEPSEIHTVFYSWRILAKFPECSPEHSAISPGGYGVSQTHGRGQGPGLVDATNSPCREYRV